MQNTQAVKLWCPHLNRNCITHKCMMWEHNPTTCTTKHKKDKPKGPGWAGEEVYGSWQWTFNAAGYCRLRKDIKAL